MKPESPHPSEEDLVLFFYGEPDARDDIRLHLQSCDACRESLDALSRTLATVDRHRVPERAAAYGAEVWARVQQRLDDPAPSGWLTWFSPRRVLLAGGLAVLLIAAFVAGRFSSRAPATPDHTAAKRPSEQSAPTNAAAQTGTIRDRVLLIAVGDHLERSQMVLVELMNKNAEGPVNISETQEWARDLVPTNRLIRETADQANEPVVSDVLDDLERTLIEIANSPSELSKAEFERVRQRIENQGLVFKIRVLDSQVREREQKSARVVQTRS